jgi:4-amino-4-deoxy-L-arabinose transferase-like glycosyltransferase
MFQNKNYVVRYFNGQPDYFDVKPPLLIWLQVLFVRAIGPEELAIRLPSAISALLTATFLIYFFLYYHKDKITGYLSALILVTADGYVGGHVARTGEHDALLVLFTTMILFIYYKYLTRSGPGNNKLVLVVILFIAGVLTKSIAVLMILPGMFIMTFVHGAWGRLLRNKYFYLLTALFIFSCAVYYLVRENMQPGYLKSVWAGELIPRYVNSNSNFYEEKSGFYYIRNLFESRFTYWMFLLIPAILFFGWKGLRIIKALLFSLLLIRLFIF